MNILAAVLFLIAGIFAVLVSAGVQVGPFHLGWLALALVGFGLFCERIPPRAA